MDIAIFCSDAADTYQLAVTSALAREASAHGDRSAVFVTNVLPETTTEHYPENGLLELAATPVVHGSVVLADAVVHRAPPELVPQFFQPFWGRNWVSIGRLNGPQPTVVIENLRAFRTLLDHLLHHHGYRDFLFLLGPETSPDGRERAAAIATFLQDLGDGVRGRTLACDFRGDHARERVLELLNAAPEDRPRVIVACNDGMALGALAAVRELGLRCPEDVAITGFDDVEIAALEFPSLTTVRQPLATLASHVMAAVRWQATGKPVAQRSETVVPTEVVFRESCGCAAQGLSTPDYRRQLSRVQTLRTQESTLLHQGSAFSLEINAALDLGSLLDGLDRFCRSLSSGALSVALFPPGTDSQGPWPSELTEVYRYEGRGGGRCQTNVALQELVFRRLPADAERVPLVFLLHNQGRRLGLLTCCFPVGWTGFFKLMAANLSTGLSRITLLETIRAHAQELETAVVQRTGELTEAVAALREEIDRRRALEAELEREQEALQAILDTQPLPVAILSQADGTIRYFNRAFSLLTGDSAPGQETPLAELRAETGDEGPYREFRLPSRQGGFLQVMAQKSELVLRGEACLIVGMMDLTRQKQLEQDLLTISENERERFGQELHDDVCQQLAALSLYTTILGQKIEARLGEALGEVAELSTLIDGILNHVRVLSRGLFPIEVGEQSLDQVFEQFLVRIEGQTRLRCRLVSNLGGHPSGLSPSDELHLFRILQEAVQNTLKYAHAQHITVRLDRAGRQLWFAFEDDGVGLPAEAREGVGLRSMRYRASQLGARLGVSAGSAGGVALSLTVLLPERGKRG